MLLMSKSDQTPDWTEIKREVTSRAYFIAGPLLEAIEQNQRCVLLIDEIDKVDYAFEAMLLELLSVWTLSIPKMGTVHATSIPHVFLTSNQERRLGDPLRRRSFYLVVEHPTAEREAAIVARRTPDADEKTHRFIAGLAKSLRAYTMEKPPSISEMNDVALAMQLLGIEQIRPEHKDIMLPLIAKTEGDRKRLLMKQAFESIVRIAGRYASEVSPEEATDIRGNLRREGGGMRRLLVLALCVMALAIQSTAETRPAGNPELKYYADAYADHYGVPRALVHAIIAQESNWNPHALSNKGAAGLMQLMPGTAEMYLVRNRFSVTENLSGGVQYLADLMTEFRGEMRLAVAAYYCGSRHIARRGLNYANPDVVSYVEAVHHRYQLELREQADRDHPMPGKGQ